MILGTYHMTSVKAQQHFNVILVDAVLDRVKIYKILMCLNRRKPHLEMS